MIATVTVVVGEYIASKGGARFTTEITGCALGRRIRGEVEEGGKRALRAAIVAA